MVEGQLLWDSNSWNRFTACKLMINTKSNLEFDRNTWNHLTVCKQMIDIE